MSSPQSNTRSNQRHDSKKRIRIGPPMVNQRSEDHAEVKLIKEGDSIKSIQVICKCGEVINIQCVYSEQSS